MIRFFILAFAFLMATASYGWQVNWEASWGFIRSDGSTPIFSGDTGAYAAQLIWSPITPVSGQGDANWVARDGGAVNSDIGHVILTNYVNDYGVFSGIYGAVFPRSYTNAILPSSGYVFVRVFDVGSDNPTNLTAFSRYFESRLIQVTGNLSFDVNEGAYGVLNFTAAPPLPSIDSFKWTPPRLAQIQIQSQPSNSYRLEYTLDLRSTPQVWQSIGTPVQTTNSLLTLSDTNATSQVRFYRVRINP
jgi:hypothetical protein